MEFRRVLFRSDRLELASTALDVSMAAEQFIAVIDRIGDDSYHAWSEIANQDLLHGEEDQPGEWIKARKAFSKSPAARALARQDAPQTSQTVETANASVK